MTWRWAASKLYGILKANSGMFGFYSKCSERAVCRIMSRGEIKSDLYLKKNTGWYVVNGEWVMGS